MTEDRLKIVVFGSFNAGKSTFIHTLDSEARHTEVNIIGGTTTVALDFGRILVGDRHIYLFGTPGQERFEFARETISRGIDGAIVIVDATADLDEFTAHICRGLHDAGIPRVIAMNKCDRETACPERIRSGLGPDEEALCISALTRDDAFRTLEHLVSRIHTCHVNHPSRHESG